MKKVILIFIAMLTLLIPMLSTPAAASIEVISQTDTGVLAAPEGVTRVEWEFVACETLFRIGVAEVTYRHTTPKKVDGGFENVVQGGYWEGGTWYGWVEFDSWIDADRGTNHGDIAITFWTGYPSVEWSFNIRHR